MLLESTPAGCAMFDYDNDGYLDILLIQSGPKNFASCNTSRPHCSLYHNNRDGTFTNVTNGSGLDRDMGYAQGVAVADYDNDGFPDLFITSYQRNFLWHNSRGSGRFSDQTIQSGIGLPTHGEYATSAAFGDYDNDGRLDLYVCYYAPWTPKTNQLCLDQFGRKEICSPQLYPAAIHRLYHNQGGGKFRDVSHESGIAAKQGRGLAVAFLDIDGDGKQDIFVANDVSDTFLWHNLGHGRFEDVARTAGCARGDGGLLIAGMGIAVADFDRSGHESIFVSNFSGQPNCLFRPIAPGMYDDQSVAVGASVKNRRLLSFGCEFVDYDADGWPDIVVANGHVRLHDDTQEEGVTFRERKQLFHNESGGHFQEVTDEGLLGDLNVPMVSRGLATGDYDNDGRVDVLVNNQNGPAQLFHNESRVRNHWVSFKTVGTRSNRDGRHARIILDAGKGKQMAVVRAGSSYLSSSDPRVFFGLDKSTRIESVEVRWPSGTRDVLKHVPIDRVVIVEEGKGIIAANGRRAR